MNKTEAVYNKLTDYNETLEQALVSAFQKRKGHIRKISVKKIKPLIPNIHRYKYSIIVEWWYK